MTKIYYPLHCDDCKWYVFCTAIIYRRDPNGCGHYKRKWWLFWITKRERYEKHTSKSAKHRAK